MWSLGPFSIGVQAVFWRVGEEGEEADRSLTHLLRALACRPYICLLETSYLEAHWTW